MIIESCHPRGYRMGYQQPMNTSDSICVRFRRIQGIFIMNDNHRRNLPGDPLKTGTRMTGRRKWWKKNMREKERMTKGRETFIALSKEDILCGHDHGK